MLRAAAIGLLFVGCANNKAASDPKEGSSPPPADAPPASGDAARTTMTNAECEAKGGRVVGDIGDGAIHRPDYKCEGGQPPIGTIGAGAEGEPVAIEGSVCCPAPT